EHRTTFRLLRLRERRQVVALVGDHFREPDAHCPDRRGQLSRCLGSPGGCSPQDLLDRLIGGSGPPLHVNPIRHVWKGRQTGADLQESSSDTQGTLSTTGDTFGVSPIAAASESITASLVGSQRLAGSLAPVSAATLVIVTPARPHGTMASNHERSLFTLSAKPCIVTHCLTWMPMLASLRPRVQTPVLPGSTPASIPSRASASISELSRVRRYQCRSGRWRLRSMIG